MTAVDRSLVCNIALTPNHPGRRFFSISSRRLAVPLPRGYRVEIWRFPGRWLPTPQLEALRADLRSVALTRLGATPAYGVFGAGRRALSNRLITVIYRNGTPAAFGTVIYCPLRTERGREPFYQLGLVISTNADRSLLYPLYFFPLAYLLVLHGFREYRFGSATMIPLVVGLIADNLADVFPHYARRSRPPARVLAIARALVRDFGPEFATSERSVFDESSFTISHCYEGPSAVLRRDFERQPKYYVAACNDFCRRVIDYRRGDDLLQIGRVHLGLFLRTVLTRLGGRV